MILEKLQTTGRSFDQCSEFKCNKVCFCIFLYKTRMPQKSILKVYATSQYALI